MAHGSGTSITGSVLESPINNEFESVDFSSVGPNDNNIIEYGPAWSPVGFYNSSTQDLVVNNGRNITLTSGVYHFRDMHLAGGSQMRIEGKVEIYVEREMRFDNGTVANISQTPDQFMIRVGEGPVNIQGGQHMHAVIYAPDASVTLANGSGFSGSIIGRTLSFDGGGGLHYDETLSENAQQTGAPQLVY